MADENSIFYKIGQATKSNVANAISGLLADNNTWTGTNDFNKAVTVGTDGEAADLTVKGGVSSTGAVSGNTVSATGAVSGGSVSATGAVSGATLSTTGNATIGGKATINGDLVVKGTTTTLSTSTLEVDDNFIHLSKGANDGAYSKDSGLYFERASGSDATAFIWDEDKGRFVLGALSGGGSTKEVTFSDVPVQIGAAAAGATMGVSISGQLGLTSPEAAGGTVNEAENFYILTGNTDSKKITLNGELRDLPSNISDNFGTGLYVWTAMSYSNGQMYSKYAVFLYIAQGDTIADVTKLHVWDDGYGMFVTTGGEYYIDSPNSGTAITSGSVTFGGATFTITSTDASAAVGADSDAVAFSGGSASITAAGAVSYTLGSYAATFTLKGYLASSSELDSLQIQAVAGGSQVVDFNNNPVPFAYNSGTLSYIADSNEPFTLLQQLITDASKLAFSASNAGTNGGFYLAGSTDATQLEVSFDTALGDGDYIGISVGGSVVMPVPAASAAPGPDADTAEVTPGKFLAGQVEIVDATDGVVALGDLADFNAGLNA